MMLDAHPDLAIPAETHFLGALLSQHANEAFSVTRYVDTVTSAATWPNFELNRAALEMELREMAATNLGDAIRCFYRLYAMKRGKGRWGDKTPTYRGSIADIADILPEVRFIHMIRDGRDVALSYRGLWFGPGDDIETQAQFWRAQIMVAREQGSRVAHYLEIRYEDLVAAPESTLRKICEFLDLPYATQMLEYPRFAKARLAEHTNPFGPPGTPRDLTEFLAIYERATKPPDPSRIGRWATEMPQSDRERYEFCAGDLLRALNYETLD